MQKALWCSEVPFLFSEGPVKRVEGHLTDSDVGGLFGIPEQRTSVMRSEGPAARFGPLGNSMDPSVASEAHR